MDNYLYNPHYGGPHFQQSEGQGPSSTMSNFTDDISPQEISTWSPPPLHNSHHELPVMPVISPDPLPQSTSAYLHLFREYISKPEHLIEDPYFPPFYALDLPQQFHEFLTSVPLTFEEIGSRHTVLVDLHTALVENRNGGFPHGSLHPFGSFLTGLGDFGSDLDIYFESESNQGKRNLLQRVVRLLRSAYKLGFDGRSRPIFTDIVPIPQAKVPIVKFSHEETGISGDISFDNMIALKNSELLKLFRELHPVVQPLTVLVKYWAKWHEFSGSSLIKNYTLALLTLVYLGKEGIVPSVEQIKTLERDQRLWSGEESRQVYNGWDTGFATNLQQIRSSHPSSLDPQEYNNSPRKDSIIFNLFEGFCNFYSKANFSTHIVSTLTAELVPKSIFQENSNIPLAIRQGLKTSSEMCVQDPFCLNFNVSLPTSGLTLVAFQSACNQASLRLRYSEPIRNFFDIFVPIPTSLLNKDFVNSRLKYMKRLELKLEVETVLKKKNRPDLNVNEEVSNFIPLHFMAKDRLEELENIGMGVGDEGVTTISCNTKTLRAIFQRWSAFGLKTRWVGLFQDFVVDFWTKGLGLDVITDKFDRKQESNMKEESDDERSLLAPPHKKQKIHEDPNEITNGVLFLKLNCSGSLPHRHKMTDIRRDLMAKLNPKLDASASTELLTENPLELLSSLVGVVEQKTDTLFSVYVKLEKYLDHQSSPMAQIISEEVCVVSDRSSPSVVPLLVSLMVALFQHYLKYQAISTICPGGIAAEGSGITNVAKRIKTVTTYGEEERQRRKIESELARKRNSSIPTNILQIPLGLGEEDPKLKNESSTIKVIQNNNSSLKKPITIHLSPTFTKTSAEDVPVITLE